MDEETQELLQKLKYKSKPDIDFEYELDIRRAHHALFFDETCPHVKGDLAKLRPDGTRQSLILEPWQVFATFNIFGWIGFDGKRRFLYVYIDGCKRKMVNPLGLLPLHCTCFY